MLSKAQASLPYRTLKTTGIIAIISNHSISKSWLTMSPKRATISSPGPFRRLITELLDVVLNEILNSKGRSGLLSISLVSRYFYIHSVPHLYRYIVLDLNRFSHQILLARLAQPGSRLSYLVRSESFTFQESRPNTVRRCKGSRQLSRGCSTLRDLPGRTGHRKFLSAF